MWRMKTLHHSTGYSVPLILISVLSMLFHDLVMLPAFSFVHFWKNGFSEVWNLCLENLCCMFYTYRVLGNKEYDLHRKRNELTLLITSELPSFLIIVVLIILCFCSIIAGNNAFGWSTVNNLWAMHVWVQHCFCWHTRVSTSFGCT